MANPEKPQLNLTLRVTLAFGVVLGAFFIIALRLWYLQILRGDFFRDRSENNRLRTIYLPPPRGLILDRNGIMLAKTRPSFNVELIAEDCPDPKSIVARLSQLLAVDNNILMERLKDLKRRRRFEARLLLKDVSRDTVAIVLAHKWELPGVIINVVPTRDYQFQSVAAHVLGYIREINKNQLENPKFAGYQMGDEVGQYGLEARWERTLQGKRGVQNIIVNATGSKVNDFSFEAEKAGHNLTLTLDLKVQQAADLALQGKRGAIVAMDPRNGEVLAMSSSPAFDPNIFTGDISTELWNELTTGKGKILSNRALQGAYPPGSIFKVFMAVAGLEEGVIREDDTVNCPGYFYFGGRAFKCHKHSGHGSVDLNRAITLSCDVYFYTVGQRLGIDRIHEYATKFGLGLRTDPDFEQENPGLIPSTAWKKMYYEKDPPNQKWFPGETISVSIGQGATTTTPMQISRGVSALVNGGILYKPQLVRKIESVGGAFRDEDFKPVEVGRVDVQKRILNKVKEAMVSVVNDPHGTGKRAQLPKELGIQAGGKTGTAQVVSLNYHKSTEGREHHAWFVGFAPAEDPQIVVTALIEHGGGGGLNAAPLVRQVMEAFFGYVPPTPTPEPQVKRK